MTENDLPIFFEHQLDPVANHEVTYWIGREYWGQGLATQALSEVLRHLKTRPLYAGAAKDNVASLRVLEKCGFTIIGYEKSFANGRNEEIEEVILELRADGREET